MSSPSITYITRQNAARDGPAKIGEEGAIAIGIGLNSGTALKQLLDLWRITAKFHAIRVVSRFQRYLIAMSHHHHYWDRKTYNRIMLLTKNFVADCVWSDWNFGPCSSSCGKGTRVGTRIKSIKEDNGGVCNGHSSITWECNGQECPGIPKINWP